MRENRNEGRTWGETQIVIRETIEWREEKESGVKVHSAHKVVREIKEERENEQRRDSIGTE